MESICFLATCKKQLLYRRKPFSHLDKTMPRGQLLDELYATGSNMPPPTEQNRKDSVDTWATVCEAGTCCFAGAKHVSREGALPTAKRNTAPPTASTAGFDAPVS